jgi:S1-C subfamily serine protease
MRRAGRLTACALVLPLLAPGRAPAGDDAEDGIRRSVVRILATQRMPDLAKPWLKQNPQEVFGTGVVIEGQRLLTSAHVVAYASQIYVQPHQSGDRLPARVARAAPGMDLAVLELADKEDAKQFFQGRPPLAWAKGLPEPKDPVSFYGYPLGASSLVVTRGAVSRIGYGMITGQETGLLIQVDAALNPGNSGGPAVVKDKMVGLAFRIAPEGQNVGFLIPNEEIERVLKAPGGGPPPAKPVLRDEVQALQNDALRRRHNLPRSARGVLVRSPASADPGYPLKAGDVITKVGTFDVDNDGMIPARENLRLSLAYAVDRLARDNKVPVTLLRQGKALAVDLPVAPRDRPLVRPLNGAYPPYFVYGPLVFSRAHPSLVNAFEFPFGDGSPLRTRADDDVAFDGEELVLVTALLPHRLAKGYHDPTGQVVRAVNGTPVRNLRHLVETLRKATGKFVEVEFFEKYVETLVFDREEVLAAMDDILADNGIRQPCSADLRDAWQPGK